MSETPNQYKKTNRLQSLTNSELAEEFEKNLDPEDLKSATRVVLTIYQTWSTRTLYEKTSYLDEDTAFEKSFKGSVRTIRSSGKNICNQFYQLIKKSKNKLIDFRFRSRR